MQNLIKCSLILISWSIITISLKWTQYKCCMLINYIFIYTDLHDDQLKDQTNYIYTDQINIWSSCMHACMHPYLIIKVDGWNYSRKIKKKKKVKKLLKNEFACALVTQGHVLLCHCPVYHSLRVHHTDRDGSLHASCSNNYRPANWWPIYTHSCLPFFKIYTYSLSLSLTFLLSPILQFLFRLGFLWYPVCPNLSYLFSTKHYSIFRVIGLASIPSFSAIFTAPTCSLLLSSPVCLFHHSPLIQAFDLICTFLITKALRISWRWWSPQPFEFCILFFIN